MGRFDVTQSSVEKSADGVEKLLDEYQDLEDGASEALDQLRQELIKGKRNRKDVQRFLLDLGDNIVDLHHDLVAGTYQHGEYVFFRINDPKPRDIHKATVRDRLLHHAIHRKFYPFFDRVFISDSFSCQVEKGTHRALQRFQSLARRVSRNNTRTCWVLKCDVKKFFASIDHRVLLDLLEERIQDGKLKRILEETIHSFETAPEKGLPLGNLTSQLFANIYMNELDQFVKHRVKLPYCRYADDFVFLSASRDRLVDILPEVRHFLGWRLHLELHPDKVFLETLASGVDFLGWIHFPHHCVPRTKVKYRIRKRVMKSPSEETLQSYLGLLSHGDAHDFSMEIRNLYWLMGTEE